MTDRELLFQLLTYLIMDGLMTEAEAIEIIKEYDRTGELPEGWQLPLALSEAIPANLREIVEEALASYARTLTPDPDKAQDDFMATVAALKFSSLSIWHGEMRDILIDYLAEQAQTGAQRILDDDEVGILTGNIAVQLAFLARFADAIASGRQADSGVEARSVLYAGEGRALWYQQNGQTNALYGWVVDYIAIDDKRTCGPCSAAEARSPYLPDDPNAPMPGRICRGRGYCRCTRQLRYDPPTYLRLGGRRA
jgi:hypothetical protein